MEIYRLNASLNWDQEENSSPWDLGKSNIELSMCCYPHRKIRIPIEYFSNLIILVIYKMKQDNMVILSVGSITIA